MINYIQAVCLAGGVPIPGYAPQPDPSCRALLLCGGGDLAPQWFGQENRGSHPPDLHRDKAELNLVRTYLTWGRPILGICRGAQIINVGLGGGIIQDIPSQTERDFPIAHRQPFGYASPSHHVSVSAGSLLARLAGCPDNVPCSLSVNSIHHQSVGRLAPGLTACAEAPDGIIEAVEMPGYPFLLGVQWHPEYLWRTDPAAAGIFKGFVEACG